MTSYTQMLIYIFSGDFAKNLDQFCGIFSLGMVVIYIFAVFLAYNSSNLSS